MAGPPDMRNGSMALSMPAVTASVELGLMTRMRSDWDMSESMALKLLSNNGCSNFANGDFRKGKSHVEPWTDGRPGRFAAGRRGADAGESAGQAAAAAYRR